MRGEADITRAAARVVGPTLIAAGLFVLLRREDLPDMVDAFVRDQVLTMIAGLVSFVAGLTLLAVHSRISTLAAFAITAIGWLMVFRGAALLFAPELVGPAAEWVTAIPHVFEATGAVVALFGAWISTVGFSARPPPLAS